MTTTQPPQPDSTAHVSDRALAAAFREFVNKDHSCEWWRIAVDIQNRARELQQAQVVDATVLDALRTHVADHFSTQAMFALSVKASTSYVSDVLNGKRQVPEDWVYGLGFRKAGWERFTNAPISIATPQSSATQQAQVVGNMREWSERMATKEMEDGVDIRAGGHLALEVDVVLCGTYPDATGWAGPGHGRAGSESPCCAGAKLHPKDVVTPFKPLHCSGCGKGSYGLHYPEAVKAAWDFMSVVEQQLLDAFNTGLNEDSFDLLAAKAAIAVALATPQSSATQQAQVVGGKIANGHHCGLPEYLCKHPSHAPQSSAPVVGEVATRIVRGCCESEPADPEHYDTLFINVETLRDIIESALTGRG